MPRAAFPSREEVSKTLQASTYFYEMSALDLRARGGSESPNAYLAKYEMSIVPLSPQQQAKIEDLIHGIDFMTKPYQRLHAIPWKIAAFQGVEQDFPHTIGDTIFVPLSILEDPDKSAMETLLHEKIHVYQRLFPLETNVLVQKVWGYRMHSLRKNHTLARNNPDLNEIVYGKYSWGMLQEFTNSANDLRDSKRQFLGETDAWTTLAERYEHPYERMAYEISGFLVSGITKEDRPQLLSWMTQYM